ncbi:putative bifunctional diguanylate cyclase/phosphodiesterase [Hyphomonas johnsonii]|uniref:putative bifunctional diguanylate cyclase/phosphodiesterase n=1 Tax=Hyphomonas johnsonii TaxID=81031 RepID=UPI0006895CEF|nr:EAL domain-containing protein [Hyphomonas johnsonii]
MEALAPESVITALVAPFLAAVDRWLSRLAPSWVRIEVLFLALGCLVTLVVGYQVDLFAAFLAFSGRHPAWNLDKFAAVVVTLALQALVLAAFRYRQMRREYAKRVDAEQTMADLALKDSLTGLANRRAFHQRLDALVSAGTGCALMMIDLDRFKPVNDLYGHDAGDELLRQLSSRIGEAAGGFDCLARLGGDEFGILLSETDEIDVLNHKAAAILEMIDRPVNIGAANCTVGASIGIAVAQAGMEVSSDQLVKRADLALYEAKDSGRGKYRYFRSQMAEPLAKRSRLEVDFRNALLRGEIEPYYQPLINLSTGNIEGYEILARWQHPELGMILPDVFVQIAEDTGTIGEMTLRLLRQACLDSDEWPHSHYLALNISPVQLRNRDLRADLCDVLKETGFEAHRLEIEVTENALIYDLETARLILWDLKIAGMTIALDDFGTGYSSLHHLRKLPIDKLKIDQSFIRTMSHSAKSRKIVNAVIALGSSMGLATTAEGVETEESALWLSQAGCTSAQGYYFGRPLPSSEAWLLDTTERQLMALRQWLSPTRDWREQEEVVPSLLRVIND